MKAELNCQVCGEWYATAYIDFVDRAHFERVVRERSLTQNHGKADQCTYCGMMTPVGAELMRWPT